MRRAQASKGRGSGFCDEVMGYLHFQKIAQRFHLSRAIGWSLVGTAITAVSGPVAALTIAFKFTPQVQGYYYTFASLLALSVLLELGFTTCLVQFVSHEYAKLHLGLNGMLAGPDASIQRLASLGRLAIRWYGIAALVFFVVIGGAGDFFFQSQGDATTSWRGAWWLLCFASALSMAMLSVTAVLDGINQVAWNTRARALQNLTRSTVLIGALWFGGGLYSAGLGALAAVIALGTQLSYWRPLFRQLLLLPSSDSVRWTTEVWPMQWRIGLSWASGYFIYSSFNPILFASAGTVVAGQFGMSWIQSVVAVSTLVTIALAVLVWIHIQEYAFAERLLSLPGIIPLLLAAILNQFVFASAVLARAERREPFLRPSLLIAVLVFFGNLVVVDHLGAVGMTWGYFIAMIAFCLLAWDILKKTYAFAR
jgi:hypothetical protein